MSFYGRYEPGDVELEGRIVASYANSKFQMGLVEEGLRAFENYFQKYSTGPTKFDGIPTIIAGKYLLNLVRHVSVR